MSELQDNSSLICPGCSTVMIHMDCNYVCEKCGLKFTDCFASLGASREKKCPKCGSELLDLINEYVCGRCFPLVRIPIELPTRLPTGGGESPDVSCMTAFRSGSDIVNSPQISRSGPPKSPVLKLTADNTGSDAPMKEDSSTLRRKNSVPPPIRRPPEAQPKTCIWYNRSTHVCTSDGSAICANPYAAFCDERDLATRLAIGG